MLLEFLANKALMALWGQQVNKVHKVFLGQLVHKVLFTSYLRICISLVMTTQPQILKV